MIDLRHGDCRNELQTIPRKSVDLVLCDPPYGISYQSARRTDKTKRFSRIAGDEAPFTEPLRYIKQILNGGG